MRISSRTVRSGMGWLAVLRGAREPVAVFVCDLSVTGSSSSSSSSGSCRTGSESIAERSVWLSLADLRAAIATAQ